MGRYKFKRSDLAPLRKFLDLPGAREVVKAAVPVKRFVPGGREKEEFGLPVPVKSRDAPLGVPLEAILLEARKEAPSIQGIMMRGGAVVVTYSKTPSKDELEKLRGLLKDGERLSRLSGPTDRTLDSDVSLNSLRDEAVSDQEWLRAFRRYAVKNLLKES